MHVGLGERDELMHWLERAVDERATLLTYLGRDPRFDALRADPRFRDLPRRIKLPLQDQSNAVSRPSFRRVKRVDINERNEVLVAELPLGGAGTQTVSVLDLDTGSSRSVGTGYLLPWAINERGTVLMNRLVTTNPQTSEVLLVRPDGTTSVLPCPTTSCHGLGLNDRDEVVGSGQLLWDAFGQVTQLPKTAGVSATGSYLYGLTGAIGVNNAGEIIGSAYRNGSCSATSYLLTPLE